MNAYVCVCVCVCGVLLVLGANDNVYFSYRFSVIMVVLLGCHTVRIHICKCVYACMCMYVCFHILSVNLQYP